MPNEKTAIKTPIEWNLSLLKDDKDPEFVSAWEATKKAYDNFLNKWKTRTDYLEKPHVLREALDDYEKLLSSNASGGKTLYYYYLLNYKNQDDTDVKAKINQYEEQLIKIGNQIQFFGLNISKIPEDKQSIFLDSPLLSDYKHYLEQSFREARHLLTESEEKIMNLKSLTSGGRWSEMFERLISKEEREVLNSEGKKEIKNYSEIMSMLSHTDKKVRDFAAKAFNDILTKLEDIAEEEINAILTNKKTDDELRNFSRPDASRHLSDDIESEVVDSLIESVTQNFSVAKKYYELKSKLMKVPKLAYHERSVPYGKLDKKYPYEESINLVEGVFGELDPEFREIFEMFTSQGHIDVFPRKGKLSGAYCIHIGKEPTYLLLNHTDKLNDVLTIAHESGHGIHNELTNKHQNSLNTGNSLATAECASTFMEDFVLEKLIKEVRDDEERLAILMMKLNDDISTIFRQIACYNFESDLHRAHREKGYLSKEEIGKIFQKNMESYMGDYVEQSPSSQNWWIYWGHIRRFFYVYSYASGLLIGKYMQGKVKKNPQFINKVKEFLSAGTSASPKEIFSRMDIDISNPQFWNEGIGEVKQLLEDTEELAKRLGKI